MRKIGLLSLLCCTGVFGKPSLEAQYAEGNRAWAARIAQLDDQTIREEQRRLAPMASGLLREVEPMIRQGSNGLAIQAALLKQFSHYGWRPMLVGFNGYTEAVPVSVNRQVGNAPPTAEPFPQAGLVKVELVAASPKAYVAQAWTFATPGATDQQRQLLKTAQEALASGIAQVRPGERLGNIGNAIERALDAGKAVAIRELCGYAMGQQRIQKPQVLGYKSPVESSETMAAGQVLNVHVIAKAGAFGVRFQPPDFWTVLTRDGQDSVMLSAMVEVTEDGHRVLSQLLD
ncbi:M24 family metallopeptidase [Pseudomonas sp. KNUC1026]|uniref:M24 family metallopeptidase n=1 Tax=Pseudomonas sp. KNUC1026 TaxID=2893890 RepID=UPI001F2C1DDF|nr:M24 family metallopeptidase [Pseudomonas sp. KNUC1026]UFH48637.1 M24 family metallopeptidase [Pseudomonas sp. KNUC1026]